MCQHRLVPFAACGSQEGRDPATAPAVAQQVRGYSDAAGIDGLVVVAPWLSRASRQALTSAGVSWADVTGNMRL
jgi:hypothetical protein